jgi:hypothetical protein
MINRSIRIVDMPSKLLSFVKSLKSIEDFHNYEQQFVEYGSAQKYSCNLLKVVDLNSSEDEVIEALELFRIYQEYFLASCEIALSKETKNLMLVEIYSKIKVGDFFASWEYDGNRLVLPEIFPLNHSGANTISLWYGEIDKFFNAQM